MWQPSEDFINQPDDEDIHITVTEADVHRHEDGSRPAEYYTKKTRGRERTCTEKRVCYVDEEVQFVDQHRQRCLHSFIEADPNCNNNEPIDMEYETSNEDADVENETICMDNSVVSNGENSVVDRNKGHVAISRLEKPLMSKSKLYQKTDKQPSSMTTPGSVQLLVDGDDDLNSANYTTKHGTHSRVERFIDNRPPLSEHYGRSEQLNQQLDFQK